MCVRVLPQITPNVDTFHAILAAFMQAADPLGGIDECVNLSQAGNASVLSRGPLGCQMVLAYIDADMVCTCVCVCVCVHGTRTGGHVVPAASLSSKCGRCVHA